MALVYDDATDTFVASGETTFDGGTVPNPSTFQSNVQVDGDLNVDGDFSIGGVDQDVWTTLVQAGDVDTASNNATPTATDLHFATAAGKVYEFEAVVIYDRGATAGAEPHMKLFVGEDGNAWKGVWAYGGINAAGTVIAAGAATKNDTAVVFGTGNVNPQAVHLRGSHVADSVGPFAIKFCQSTSSAREIVVKAGSFLRYRVLN